MAMIAGFTRAQPPCTLDPPCPVHAGTTILGGEIDPAIVRSSDRCHYYLGTPPAKADVSAGTRPAAYGRNHIVDSDRVEGPLKEAGGKIKEEWGDATDDASTETEGKMDQAEGKVQNEWGEAKDDVRDAVDSDR
jgi:uncharacterized protein YjbJ (UPF0337 family)